MPIIQSVERALKILDLFNEQEPELRITEISERMHLNKSTVHSLLRTLQEYGYIERNTENGKYKLGLKLFERGNFVTYNLDTRTIARKYLLDLSLKTGHTLHLVILEGKEAVYIDKVEGKSGNVEGSRIGRRATLHSSGVGKVLFAFRTEEEMNQILDGYIFEKRTTNTLTNKEDFLEEIAKIKKQGYAIDKEENEPGISCIAFPIYSYTNKVIAAFSISMPTPQLNDEQLNRIIPIMEQTAEQISKEMGYRS
ncbi:IclR family transcriptional regulator [Halobacillus karajensis]|uniref:Glycerol operon regulatory protein n=1 Tax=Halobacillus karajensis TaxID=195088 RepID=A0A024P376_9BACI|nr:IclR family transcriptional regulator [Halobacillus karajensis]CDQ20024.1 Transcriptional regulator KdgR [Halobacillus karajensis]CDQ22483.1 Transcriptional regulator KdgR [Halobacillus karajensis]CDQ28327.1 Transcriptional regulator KdgR [Halobacillus karajensis]